MISCGAVRAHMLDVARRGTSEAISLEVESHIQGCAACEDECARWRLFGVLKEAATPVLGEAAERRILSRLSTVVPDARKGPRPERWRGPVAGVVCAAAALGILVFGVHRAWRPVSTATVVEGQQVEAIAPGEVSFGGAQVRYVGGARMTFHPDARTLRLSSGEVDVDVTPGLPGHFRVVTPRFVVEVLGTRFVVTPEGVRTVRGRVHVLDEHGQELAVLTAGMGWRVPDERPAVAPVAPPVSHPPSPAAGAAAARPVSVPAGRAVSVADLLARSRAALARGEVHQARALAQRALAAGPSDRESAMGQLLLADTSLVDKHPQEAIEAYRRIVRRWSRAPEAEVAQFAVGQLLLERGSKAEAAVAFNDYLARYPVGRFVREAREHLSLIQSGR